MPIIIGLIVLFSQHMIIGDHLNVLAFGSFDSEKLSIIIISVYSGIKGYTMESIIRIFNTNLYLELFTEDNNRDHQLQVIKKRSSDQ